MRFPDLLPEANTTRPEGVAAPEQAAKPNRRGKRAVHGPDEDRSIHGPTDTTSAGPLVEDRTR